METEYIRGKIQERAGALTERPAARFELRGNDVWAARSGRVYQPDSMPDSDSMVGGEGGYSSPVTGNGMGDINRLVGGRKRRTHEEHPGKLHPISYWKKIAKQHLSGGSAEPMLNPYDAHRALMMDWRGGKSPFFTKTGAPRSYMMHESLHGSGLWDSIKALGSKVAHEFTDPDSKLRKEYIPKATAIVDTVATVASAIGPAIPPPFGEALIAGAQGARGIAHGIAAVNSGIAAVQHAAKGDFKGAYDDALNAYGSYNGAKGALANRATSLAKYGEQRAAKDAASTASNGLKFIKDYNAPKPTFMTTAAPGKPNPKFMTEAALGRDIPRARVPAPPAARSASSPFVAPRTVYRESQPYSSTAKPSRTMALTDIGRAGYRDLLTAKELENQQVYPPFSNTFTPAMKKLVEAANAKAAKGLREKALGRGRGGAFAMETPRRRLAQMGANLSPFGDAIGAQSRHSAAMNRVYGSASPDYATLSLLTKGKARAEGAAKPRHGLKGRSNARAQIVGRIMRERGVSLPEASKIVKAEGLY